MSELKPCPFCKCQPSLEEVERQNGQTSIEYVCDGCNANPSTGYVQNEQQSRFDWNYRPIERDFEAKLAGLIEAAGDAVEIIDKAGLLHLSNGVQLGQTVWYVKATECFDRLRRQLANLAAAQPTTSAGQVDEK